MATIGVITEQGDLGLGFDELTAQEQSIVENNKNIKEDSTMAPEVTTK